MQIFRVENSRCIGPYNDMVDDDYGTTSMYKWRRCDNYKHSVSEEPAPWLDGIERHSKLHRFGFASLDQLLAWFGNEALKFLETCGQHVTVYEVDQNSVKFGHSQVAFLWHEATKVMTL